MKAKKIKMFVEVEYWDCGCDTHRHRTEAVANKCIERKANTAPRPPVEVQRARYICAATALIEGETLKTAGERVGVCGARARDLANKVFRTSFRPELELKEPTCCTDDLPEMRKHKEEWIARINAVAKYWGV